MSKIINYLQHYEIGHNLDVNNHDVKNHDVENHDVKNHKMKNHETNNNCVLPKLNQYYWFYYICKYGEEYNKTLELATADKFSQIESVRNNLSGLKLLKIKKQSFEEDLIYAKNIHISTLKVLAYYNQLSLLILKNGCYYFFNYGTEICVLKYGKMYKITEDELKNIQENNYYIPMVDKIMYASSHYRLNDLHDIAKQLGISYNKMLKTDLYNCIKIKLMQII